MSPLCQSETEENIYAYLTCVEIDGPLVLLHHFDNTNIISITDYFQTGNRLFNI